MASFIEGYSGQQLPPPYGFRDVRLWSFPLLARFDKVESLVRRILQPAANNPSDVSFDLLQGNGPANSGLLTFVYMMVLDYRKMFCLNPPESAMGYYTQKELLFGIPVIQRSAGLLPKIAFFSPYIFVDNGGSMVCGNTVLGYQKQPGWFQVQPPGGGDYPIRIDVPVMALPGPDTVQSLQRLVHVQAVGPLAVDLANLADDALDIVGEVLKGVVHAEEDLGQTWPFGPIERLLGQGGALPMPQDLLAVFRERPEISYDILQLKQIRSAQDPTQACYRALLGCTSKLREIRSFGLLPEADIDLAAYASLDIVRDLGLIARNGRVRPLFPYRMECDFDFVDAREQPL